MSELINGNLFDTKARWICHQVNCKRRMGSGVALQVKERYPHVYRDYMLMSPVLGNLLVVPTEPDIYDYFDENYNGQFIVNMFCQDNYGYDGKRYTNYEAFAESLEKLRDFINTHDKSDIPTVAFPYKIGCDRGGADWKIISTMIETILKDFKIEYWKLG